MFLCTCFQTGPEAHSAFCTMCVRFLCRVVALTTLPRLQPRLRMSRATPLLFLSVCMAYYGETFTFSFTPLKHSRMCKYPARPSYAKTVFYLLLSKITCIIVLPKRRRIPIRLHGVTPHNTVFVFPDHEIYNSCCGA